MDNQTLARYCTLLSREDVDLPEPLLRTIAAQLCNVANNLQQRVTRFESANKELNQVNEQSRRMIVELQTRLQKQAALAPTIEVETLPADVREGSITISQAEELSGKSYYVIKKRIDDGEIEGFRHGSRYYVVRQSLMDWIEGQNGKIETPASEEAEVPQES